MLRRLPPPPEPPPPPLPALAPPLLLEPVDVMLPPFPLLAPLPPPLPPLPARAPPLLSLPGPAITEPPFPPEAANAMFAESAMIIKIEAAAVITFFTIWRHSITTNQ